MRTEKRKAEEIVAAMEEARARMDLHGLHHLKKEFTDLVLEEDRRDKEMRARRVVVEHGSYEGGLTFTATEPPKHECPRHGSHPRWIALYGYGHASGGTGVDGETMPAYCMDCLVGLLDREKVGRVLLKG